MVAITDGVDVMGANFSAIESLPASTIKVGYSTGSGGVPWTAAQWAKYPDALRIDQDPAASDHTADYLDVENGAATIADCPGWAKAAQASFSDATRPGQRTPAIYTSGSNVTAVVNTLIAGGVKSGVGLVVADWTYNVASAEAQLAASGGPFPVVGVQYSDQGGGGAYDLDVFLTSWVSNVSKKEPFPVRAIQNDWAWCGKCQGLFYGPEAAKSACPAGAHHVAGSGYNYEITYED